jgi:cytochrome c oxidase assembly protein subunit 15
MFIKKDIEHRTLFRLSLAAFLIAIVVIFLGAFTRLADAGLGCPDWPGCYGHLLWPNDASEISKAEAAFPETPVETDKTWPEMIHRYFAGTLGLFILAIAIVSIRQRRSTDSYTQRTPFKLPLLLLVLVIVQAAFGMWTVTLKLWPQVVSAHLLGGFATLALLCLLVQRLGTTRWHVNAEEMQRLNRIKPVLLFALVAIIAQIALGGWVSSNYAALACPDFPQCLGQWNPPTNFSAGFNVLQDIGPNYLGGQLDNHARTAIHLTHRLGAAVVLLTMIIMSVLLWRTRVGSIHDWVIVLWGVLFVQFTLGMSNILFALPLSVAVGHNIGGAVLLLTQVTIVYRSYNAKLIAA